MPGGLGRDAVQLGPGAILPKTTSRGVCNILLTQVRVSSAAFSVEEARGRIRQEIRNEVVSIYPVLGQKY